MNLFVIDIRLVELLLPRHNLPWRIESSEPDGDFRVVASDNVPVFVSCTREKAEILVRMAERVEEMEIERLIQELPDFLREGFEPPHRRGEIGEQQMEFPGLQVLHT